MAELDAPHLPTTRSHVASTHSDTALPQMASPPARALRHRTSEEDLCASTMRMDLSARK